MLEGNRFWFYSLVCSLLKGLMEIYGQKKEIVKINEKKVTVKTGKKGLKRRLISDSFDLLIPGSVTGWIYTPMGIVGCAGVVSTVLSSKDIWDGLG